MGSTQSELLKQLEDPAVARELARRVAILGNHARLRIMAWLVNAEDGMVVLQLGEKLGLTQPTVSKHLRLLRKQGLVTRTPKGSWAVYRATESARELIKGLEPLFVQQRAAL